MHVPVTKIIVGVKIKKMLLVNTPGRDTNPIFVGLYLPTRIEVEAATVFAAVPDEDEADGGGEVAAAPALVGSCLLVIVVTELVVRLEADGLVDVCDSV